jgi:hypothetical protein
MGREEPALLAREQGDKHTIMPAPAAQQGSQIRSTGEADLVRQWNWQRNLTPDSPLAANEKHDAAAEDG